MYTNKMDYRKKSFLTVGILLFFMLVVAVFVNNLEGTITGVVVQSTCECGVDNDCDDGNSCQKIFVYMQMIV